MAGCGAKTVLRLGLCLILLTAPVAGQGQERMTDVVTSEYRFTPNNLTFKRGTAYRLHLENHGKETHEFTAPEFFKAVKLGNPGVLNADRTEIVLQPGETKELHFVAKTAGQYKLRCSDHDWAGMTGQITVK